MNISRIKALALMRYHLAKQDQWQQRAAAREQENLQLAREMKGRDTLNTPLDYYSKRIEDDDFWLKRFASNRDLHQKQALMWAAAAEALKEKSDDQ